MDNGRRLGCGVILYKGVFLISKGKYREWLTEDKLILLGGWARDGLSDEQIAHNIGISRSTLSDWKNKHLDIADALKKNKEIADYEIENALFEKAKSGDVGAMIFWLKNRRPSKWKDKPISDNEEVIKKLDEIIGDIDVIADK